MFKSSIYSYCFWGFFSILLCGKANADDIFIYIRDDVYYDYKQFVDGRNIIEIDSFVGATVRRDVVDMVLAQQALLLGGFKHKFKYMPGKLNFRNTKMLESGELLMSFDSYWLADADRLRKDIYISKPLIRKGEYIAGIYTAPNNTEVLSIKNLNDLSAFSAVSTPKWITDWQTLEALPIKNLVREDEWLSQARMVAIGWVDFMLMAFHSTNDNAFNIGKYRLIPVPNIGIVLKDSRHLVISKNHPMGKAAFSAINKGLNILRQENRIVSAYKQAGFFIDQTEIKVLNSQ